MFFEVKKLREKKAKNTLFHTVYLQRCWKLNKKVFGKVFLEKKHVTFEIEKEISNYVKEMFFY